MGKPSRQRPRATSPARPRAAFATLFVAVVAAGLPLSWANDAWSGAAPKRTTLAHVGGIVTSRAIGRSLGSPTEGRLLGGAHLDETPYLRVVPSYAGGDVRWGLEGLVSLLDHAARAVNRQFPGTMMSVGHLSRPGGGEVDRHASHESGRDADVGFYVRTGGGGKAGDGRPIYAEHFVAFKGDGTAPSWPGAHFDDARNWALVSALVSDGHARVSYIFVAAPLRSRLLAYAERVGAPASIRQRAAELMAQPRGSLPHDDHFHVRIACPSGMDGCIEFPTLPRDRIARAPHAPALGARGRGSATVARQTPAPRPAHPSLPSRAPEPAPRAVPTTPIAPADRGETADTADVPATPIPVTTSTTIGPPPAAMTTTIDDVDGPLPKSDSPPDP
jgi:penicillin-insensitive murein endopeptidase